MITVLCPTYNEEKFINELLDFLSQSKPLDKEIIIIDGGSTDRTVEIINKRKNSFSNLKILINPRQYVPYALNLGIKYSTGNPIIRLDAHTRYSFDYFEKILKTFDETGADIIGGPMNAIGENDFQKGVAYATSTRFGIGNSKLHDVSFTGFSDHVYLGAWKRQLFDEIGWFDERLKRNQDDEFHYRAKSMGKKIFLNAEIKSYYYPRSTFKGLMKQYFQYGEYKPIVLKKIKSEIKVRHIIPAVFIIYLITFPFWLKFPILFAPASIYFIIDVWFSFKNRYNYKIKMLSFIIYPLIHIAYGSGTIIGIKNLFKKL